MKIINVSQGPVYLDDIGVVLPYSSKFEPVEIRDLKALRSRALRFCLSSGHVIDAGSNPSEEQIKEALKRFEERLKESEKILSKNEQLKTLLVDDKKPVNNISKVKIKDYEGSAVKKFHENGEISVVWTGPASDHGGYARMNRKFMFGLDDLGVNVKYAEHRSLEDVESATRQRLSKLSSNFVQEDAIKVYGMTAPTVYDWSRYKCLFTMMETRQLHPAYADRCNFADEIIVPSRWCERVFRESGVKKPMTVVPLGVDTSIYKPDVEPVGFSKGLKSFVFLSVFGWSMRKGYDVLLKAYLEEFSSDEDVTLLISSRFFGSTEECKKDVIRKEIARISSMVNNPKKPHICLFGDGLSDQMMPRLYAAADAYVLISRGEGFGLPYIEAAACNLPVIASNYSGQTDFLTPENSYLVEVDGFQSSEKDLAWISYFYENAEFPIFGRESIEHTKAHMRHVFENKEEANKKAELLHQKIVQEYSWDVCVNNMYEKLKNTYRSMK